MEIAANDPRRESIDLGTALSGMIRFREFGSSVDLELRGGNGINAIRLQFENFQNALEFLKDAQGKSLRLEMETPQSEFQTAPEPKLPHQAGAKEGFLPGIPS